MKTVGIIGLGTFGRFMAGHLAAHGQVLSYDKSGLGSASLDEVLAQPVIILAVPVQHLETLLREIGSRVRPGALVVDVSSVKTIPVELMKRYLPESCEIVATHPLFGPQSGAKGIEGLKMVTWPVRVADERYAGVKRFLTERLELEVIEIAPEEHDREMAYVQALTFFMGRALGSMDLPESPLRTVTYQHLLDMKTIVMNDTPELFETIQHYNPFASEIREQFTQKLDELEQALEAGKK